MTDNARPSELEDVWIGDLLRAWHALGAESPEERARVAAALGLRYTPRAAPPASTVAGVKPPAPGVRARADSRGQMTTPGGDSSVARETGSTPPPAPQSQARVIPALFTDTRQATESDDAPPAWLQVDSALPRELDVHRAFRPPLDPLFRPAWTRAIVGSACATPVSGGSIDIDRLVEQLARARPLVSLPFRTVASVSLGAQILIDRGEAMAPYFRDEDDLVGQIAGVVGRDRVQLIEFEHCPVPERTSPSDDELESSASPYAPPAPGVPVVVISDLGIARASGARDGAPEEQWLAFAERVRSAGCPAIAFVPYPPRRWPPRLRQLLHILQWDRTTTAQLARRTAAGEQRG